MHWYFWFLQLVEVLVVPNGITLQPPAAGVFEGM
jgi:hypothetical protein